MTESTNQDMAKDICEALAAVLKKHGYFWDSSQGFAEDGGAGYAAAVNNGGCVVKWKMDRGEDG